MENGNESSLEKSIEELVLKRAEILKKAHQQPRTFDEYSELSDQARGFTRQIEKGQKQLHPPVYSHKIPEELRRTCFICDKVFPTVEESHSHYISDCEIRKIDNAIAEEVMGWIYGEDEMGNREWVRKNGDRTGWGEHQCMSAWEPAKDLRQIFWAMRELQEKRGWNFEISTSKNGVAGSYIRITSPYGPRFLRFGAEPVELDFPGMTDKMPLCICKTILEAKLRW